ncbi:MAG: FkbM family methyltransferase [Candidatus Schekmanbacteria bacterium]|nr:MAG: FkbM family methyltransferase [Candidatus Schekmanbacteria bacterium]
MLRIKQMIQKIFNLFGYRISRIDQRNLAHERKVANAFYQGHCFKVFMNDSIGDAILTGEGWDNHLQDIFGKYLSKSSGDILEIGANIGASFIPIAGRYPNLTFHCIEPIPDFYELLEFNKSSFGCTNVKLYNCAMGDVAGNEIVIHGQVGTAGALKRYDEHRYVDSFTLPIVTVDQMFSGYDIKMIKIDVDGNELSVLQGARKVLTDMDPLLFIEFHLRLMRDLNINPRDFLQLIQNFGYKEMTIWDNFGSYIGTIQSFDELLDIAESVPWYVDVLFQK